MQNRSLYKPSNIANLALLLFASLLYILNFVAGSDFLSLVVTLFLSFSIFVSKKEVLLPMMIYLSFFSMVMVYGGSYLSIFIVLAFFLRVVIDTSFKALGLIIVFFIYFLIHIISTGLDNLSIGRINEILSFFLILPAGYAFSKCKSKDCVIYFIAGFLVSTLFGFARSYLPRLDKVAGDTDVTFLEDMDEANRFSGISNDSNFYAILAVVVLFILLFKILTSSQSKENDSRLVTLALIVGTFVLGVLTYSKSFIACAFILFVAYSFLVKKISFGYVLRIAVAGIIILSVFSTTISTIEGAYLLRFGDDTTDMDMITSNRTIIWAGYLKDISNFSLSENLFGAGMIYNGKVAAHNTYIQLFYQFGIVGFIANILLLYKSKKVFVNKKNAKYSLIIIALLIALFFNLSGYTFSSSWAVLSMMFICCSNDEIMA